MRRAFRLPKTRTHDMFRTSASVTAARCKAAPVTTKPCHKRVVVFQALPDMEDHAARIGRAACRDQQQRGWGQGVGERVRPQQPAPADGKIEEDRQAVETAGQGQL